MCLDTSVSASSMFGNTCWFCLKFLHYYLLILFSLAYPSPFAYVFLFVFSFAIITKNWCEQTRRRLLILIKWRETLLFRVDVLANSLFLASFWRILSYVFFCILLKNSLMYIWMSVIVILLYFSCCSFILMYVVFLFNIFSIKWEVTWLIYFSFFL